MSLPVGDMRSKREMSFSFRGKFLLDVIKMGFYMTLKYLFGSRTGSDLASFFKKE